MKNKQPWLKKNFSLQEFIGLVRRSQDLHRSRMRELRKQFETEIEMLSETAFLGRLPDLLVRSIDGIDSFQTECPLKEIPLRSLDLDGLR